MGIIGPEDEIAYITITVGLSIKNAINVILMLADCADVALPEWKDAGSWVLENISNLAKRNGGGAEKTVDRKKIALQVSKPSIVLMSINFKPAKKH